METYKAYSDSHNLPMRLVPFKLNCKLLNQCLIQVDLHTDDQCVNLGWKVWKNLHTDYNMHQCALYKCLNTTCIMYLLSFNYMQVTKYAVVQWI